MNIRAKEDNGGWLRVVCEECMAEACADCVVCAGKRYYFWDPVTFLCYFPNKEPIYALNENGERVHVIRTGSAAQRKNPNFLTIEDMLTFLGEWAAQDKRRRFKLWYEDGWNCYAWPNRYKATVIAATAKDLLPCVEQCYREVTSLNS